MKRLIVNADDFNTDGARSRGILDAVRSGIVTSTSVLTNLPWASESLSALEELAASGAGIGVHLNLTKGCPFCAKASSLTTQGGSFFSKHAAWRRALRRGFEPREAEEEFAAQIQALFAAGYTPDHVDGNNHMHIFPGLAGAAAAAAVRFGIRGIRLPLEPLYWSLRGPGRAVVKKCFISLLSLRAKKIFRRAGLYFPERCAGLHEPAPGEEKSLVGFLARLPGGTTELMCHPGYAGGESGYSTPAREKELGALTSAAVLAAVADNRIILTTFRDRPCA